MKYRYIHHQLFSALVMSFFYKNIFLTFGLLKPYCSYIALVFLILWFLIMNSKKRQFKYKLINSFLKLEDTVANVERSKGSRKIGNIFQWSFGLFKQARLLCSPISGVLRTFKIGLLRRRCGPAKSYICSIFGEGGFQISHSLSLLIIFCFTRFTIHLPIMVKGGSRHKN